MKIKIGLIGYGYWGPNLLRNFLTAKDCQVVKVCDARQERLDLVNKINSSISTTVNIDELCTDINIDAIVISTPVYSHYELAKKSLLNGKHVLIEKPLTASVSQAEELIDIAIQKNLILMVDHTFLYTGAVKKIKSLIDNDEIGKMQYFDSTRINLGLFQADVNVLWDLAPHDISILTYLTKEIPYSINAKGISHTNNGIENIAYMTINYQEDFIAHFNCSWTSPVKVRQTLIGGDKKMILYNDLEPSEKLRIYDTSYSHKTDDEKNKILVDYRIGDIFLPKLQNDEALLGVASDFILSIIEQKEPISNSILGLEVVKILEAAQISIKNNGKEVKI
jgi:predicted dehydrogenase